MSVQPTDNQYAVNIANDIVIRAADAAEDAPPVDPLAATAAASAVPVIGVADEADTTPEDVVQVTMEARARAREMRKEQARRTPADPNDAQAFLNTTSSPAVRELLATFQNYDNSQAVARFDNYLTMFTRYASTADAGNEQTAEANLRAAENAYYQYLGISHYEAATRELREDFSNAIERWYVGEGVFSPEMFDYSSADGFRFSPYSQESQNALLYRTVLASYDRQQIAQYLREMARLTPNDFLWYDPTGLEALRLDDRRRFLQQVDQLLTDAEINARAADLQYSFNQDGTLDLAYLDEQLLLERQRLEDYILQRTDKYGQALNIFQQYGLAAISASFLA